MANKERKKLIGMLRLYCLPFVSTYILSKFVI
jgi:hypothetical protein